MERSEEAIRLEEEEILGKEIQTVAFKYKAYVPVIR